MKASKWYMFNQNNSGGVFDVDERVCEFVVIEALDADQANDRAETLGIYFNGVAAGTDCECCGDRWYRAHENYAAAVPSYYGTPLESIKYVKQAYIYPLHDDMREYKPSRSNGNKHD